MWSDKRVRKELYIGYTFMYRGEHCTVIRLYRKCFRYSTLQMPGRNYMHYKFFQSIPHFRQKYKDYFPRQKSLNFEPGFVPLVEKIVGNIREGKSPNQKIYIN